jgi:hypothetical protein
MLRTLQKKTGMTYRDVVRGVSTDVLAGAARQTKEMDAKNVHRIVNSAMRRPFKTKTGEKIGVMKNGNVWYQGANWPRNRWVLLRKDGKLQASETGIRSKTAGRQKLSARLQGQIRQAISSAMNYKMKERKYLLGRIGLGKASWLEIMRKLRMKIPGGAKLKNAKQVRMPSKASSAALGREVGNQDSFQVIISNRVQAALNNNARGIGAFARSLNGVSRRFKKKTGEDLEKYAKRFAKKNGFIVK